MIRRAFPSISFHQFFFSLEADTSRYSIQDVILSKIKTKKKKSCYVVPVNNLVVLFPLKISNKKKIQWLGVWKDRFCNIHFLLCVHFTPPIAKQAFFTVSVICWCLKVQWIIQPLYPSCFAAHLLSSQSTVVSINSDLLYSSNFMPGLS